MKIGITCYPTYGGSGIVATELGLELAARGHEVHFITYANPIRLGGTQPRIHYHEVEVAGYPLFEHQPYTLALASRMAEVAERYGLDLLHVHYAIPHSVSAFLAQRIVAPRRLPFITTLHGTDITLVGVERAYFPITRFSIENSDGVTAISEYLRGRTVEVFGVRNPIRVIRNFVNCSLYRPDQEARRRQPFAPASSGILIHISNFRPVKRVLDCVRILAEVRRETAAHLLMVGDGPDRAAAERLAFDLGLGSHVSFLGKQQHIERLLPMADVLLLPSELEGFGLAALEAMACGVPAIATRAGGVPEVISHGEDGFMEAPGDIAAQASHAIRLLRDPDFRRQVGEAARRTAVGRFSTEILIPEYERYYEEVAGGA